MPKLIVVDVSGAAQEIDAFSGRSVMENIRASGFGDLLALCGGCCSCATCHVVVDPAWAKRVGEAGQAEEGLMEGSKHRVENSRLSCQILMTEDLDGLRVTIAPED